MRGLLLALLALAQLGCFHSWYLAQAAAGQDDIAYRARPLGEVLADEATPERTRRMLALVQDVKQFGEEHGIRPTDNYQTYAELHRPVAVWVVTAAPKLGFEAKTWWFPIVGTVPYLGWFDRGEAERHARQLREEGWDVHLRGAGAYSTLGWFDDPVLSTMLARGDVAGMVNVVLHESVHATHYVPSQSVFNESLADFVADGLTLRYLERRLRADRWQLHEYRAEQARRERVAERFARAFDRLQQLYSSRVAAEDKLAEKHRVLQALRVELGLDKPLDNAVLMQSRTYHSGAGRFEAALAACGGDYRRLMQAVRCVGPASFPREQHDRLDDVLAPLARACRCPARR